MGPRLRGARLTDVDPHPNEPKAPPADPRATGGTALVVLFTVAAFLEAALWGQVNAFAPLHFASLGVKGDDISSTTALATLIATAVGIPTLPFWGALADRYARKPVIVRSYVAYVVGGAIAAAAGNVPLFIVGRTLMALSLGNGGLMMTTLEERVPAKRIGLAFAVFNSAPPIGSFLGPLIAGPLVDARGVRVLLGIDSVVMLVVVAALSFGYRDRYEPTEKGRILDLALGSLRLLVSTARLRVLFPTLFLLFGGWLLASLYLPVVVEARFPTDELATRIGRVLALGGAATVVIAPLLGALADRVGVWRVLAAAAFLEAACWSLPQLATSFGAFAAAWALVNGLASGVFSLAFTALATSAPKGARGRVMAFAYLPSTGGYAIASLFGVVAPGAVVGGTFIAALVIVLLGAFGVLAAQRAPGEAAE